ncbi:hypothetical protein D3C81_1803300 [compost metagenome]
MVEGKTLALCCGGPVGHLRLARLLLKWKCTRIRLAYSTAGKGATFRFIGLDDQLLEERRVESGTWVHFQVTQGQLVCRIDVESSDHGSIDNLTVWHRGEVNPIEK